jgi:CRISPR system Cascade subunit CasC
MESNFLNYHVLISHSPSCLNRDDMNMQKTAVFGGVRRVRISSQSLKYAMRQGNYFREKFGGASIRTNSMELLKNKLQEAFSQRYNQEEFDKENGKGAFEKLYSKEAISQAVETWVSKDKKEKNKKDKNESVSIVDSDDKGEAQHEDKKLAVAPWCIDEIQEFINLIHENPGVKPKELEELVKKQAIKFHAALGNAIDISLFGRMATTDVIMTQIDGCMAVAHAITTHEVEADIDWFTAVDDLKADAGETGAGHLNTQEFSSGVFYRYASLNIGQLQQNLGNVGREKALEVAKELFYLLATTVPQAKQQPFAAFNRADFAMVSFSDQPISLANAFEQPIKKADRVGGYLTPSIKKIMEYWNNVYSAYELSDKTIVLDVQKEAKNFVPAGANCEFATKMSEVKEWIQQGGR